MPRKLEVISPARKPDLFDRIEYEDIFDRVELDPEAKAAFSEENHEVIREEIRKAIAALPVAEMISKAIEKATAETEKAKKEMADKMGWMKLDHEREMETYRKEMAEMQEKFRKKYDDLRTKILEPRYEFGGYPTANGGLPFVNWRLVEDGVNLSVQKKVNDTWTEVFAFTPNA